MTQRPNNFEDLIEAIQENTEWLQTTEEDEVECISIENLEGILKHYFNKTIKLTTNGN
jgi:hypothetical protein